MAPRPCLDCGTPAPRTRCRRCEARHQHKRNQSPQRDKYRGDWARIAKAAIAQHRATHGDICPGYRTPPHPVTPDQWTCDHDLGPLCRPCNGRKGATEDKGRGTHISRA